jgi:hypothetical protein
VTSSSVGSRNAVRPVARSVTAWAWPLRCCSCPSRRRSLSRSVPRRRPARAGRARSAPPACAARSVPPSDRPGAVSAQGDDGDAPSVIGAGESGDDGTTGGPLQGRAGGVDRVSGEPVDTSGDQRTDSGGAGVAEVDDLDGEQGADVISQPRATSRGVGDRGCQGMI